MTLVKIDNLNKSYTTGGETTHVLKGTDLKMKKGEMIILPAGEPHAINAVTKFKMMLIMVRS